MFIVINRATAHANGKTHYFTGKPCSAGHTALRYVSTGNCVQCQKERSKSFASGARKAHVAAIRGHFSYPAHPDDHAALLAYAQALDLSRGVAPHVPAVVQPLREATTEDIQRIREIAFHAVKAEPDAYMPKL